MIILRGRERVKKDKNLLVHSFVCSHHRAVYCIWLLAGSFHLFSVLTKPLLEEKPKRLEVGTSRLRMLTHAHCTYLLPNFIASVHQQSHFFSCQWQVPLLLS
ncbi:hypothetical protein BCR43DRAFT_498088 [Syncephalastrum racemosum]|uniref:Uncharacterized protein n=1 Tax=Syncephalastrum racemosum TaxID=13706 RepID=A0A1X2H3A5_SYNRA|nr:hypothetical protein BCR43DRAFT_498088 [Syncephalastrum racemosum]